MQSRNRQYLLHLSQATIVGISEGTYQVPLLRVSLLMEGGDQMTPQHLAFTLGCILVAVPVIGLFLVACIVLVLLL